MVDWKKTWKSCILEQSRVWAEIYTPMHLMSINDALPTLISLTKFFGVLQFFIRTKDVILDNKAGLNKNSYYCH